MASSNSLVAQLLRDQCNKAFRDHNLNDVAGALQMLTADLVMVFGMSEEVSLGAADAIAADIRNIIRERFAAAGKGH